MKKFKQKQRKNVMVVLVEMSLFKLNGIRAKTHHICHSFNSKRFTVHISF